MALLKRKRIGLNDAMSVVTRFVNACNRHDADGVGACLHPDFDSIQPMYPTRNFRGADQVRRNWQAIFDAEPGFRLTVLRSASMDDTVWLELHGAGRDAEVAGVFIMGIQGDRIRWARIYSALVEPVPEGMGEPAAPLHEVREGAGAPAAGNGEVVDEDLIAPVLDIERSGRRRRQRPDDDGTDGEIGEDTAVKAPAAEGEPVPEPPPEEELEVLADAEPVAVAVVDEGGPAVALLDADGAVVDVDPDADVAVAELVIDGGPAEVVAVVVAEPEARRPGDEADDGGPPTEAVEMVTLTEAEPDAGPEPDLAPEPPPAATDEPAPDEPAPEPPKRLFGKRPRR